MRRFQTLLPVRYPRLASAPLTVSAASAEDGATLGEHVRAPDAGHR